jgi:aminoglycoside 6'-N-acetyltransferase I
VFMTLRDGLTDTAPLTETVRIRDYTPRDHPEWLAMRLALWPDSSEADAHAWAISQEAKTLVAEVGNHEGLAGFVELGKRAYADGCDTSPVAFLEGWYVSPSMRKRGIGRMLLCACVVWAKQEGLHELGSDSLLLDVAAYAAHISVGFEEVERSIKYRMVLG